MLRSCYRTLMRLARTGMERELEVRWFFLPDDSPVLPFPTRFGSRNWDGIGELGDRELGEVSGAERVWVNGSDFAGEIGMPILGTAEDFMEGCSITEVICVTMDYREIKPEFFRTIEFIGYHYGNSPPSPPDVPTTEGVIFASFFWRVEAGEGDTAAGHFTHILVVASDIDIRDDYDEGTPGAQYDVLYFPDAGGTPAIVRFSELFRDYDGTVRRRVYLDRKTPPWPQLDI